MTFSLLKLNTISNWMAFQSLIYSIIFNGILTQSLFMFKGIQQFFTLIRESFYVRCVVLTTFLKGSEDISDISMNGILI